MALRAASLRSAPPPGHIAKLGVAAYAEAAQKSAGTFEQWLDVWSGRELTL